MKRMTLLFCLVISGICLAQDDPGLPDSLIIGNFDRSPVNAILNHQIAVPIWVKTDDSVAFAHIPVATRNEHIINRDGGRQFPPISYCESLNPHWTPFRPPLFGFPSQEYTTQSYLPTTYPENDTFGRNCILITDYQWWQIGEFWMTTTSDTSMVGDTSYTCEGYDPRMGGLYFGLTDGLHGFMPYTAWGGIVILRFFPGDANNSGEVNGLDVVFLVNYFKGFGSPPEPFLAGDANGNCVVNGMDVIYLVNYLKGIGPAPVAGQCP